MNAIPDATPLLHMHAQELRDKWQVRCLVESQGRLAAVMLSVLMHSYTRAMTILLRVAFPGFRDINTPYISSAATIVQSGRVVAEITHSRELAPRPTALYRDEGELVKDFRDLADRLKLNDAERVELTAAVKRWVVADLRINHMGEKVA